ncbi:MAG: hypothetical protein ABL982_07645 [Vicinamibacterales bacterium]
MYQPRVFSLNAHAAYTCRHSGACCTAGWSIPVEARTQTLVHTEWLLPDDSGACPQYDRPSGLCRIHRDHGAPLLPESCHHFPRRARLDARGTSIALSHYCPTAAALLLDGTEPLAIVASPAAFPASRAYEGLDATEELPPLLRPDALFDAPSFERWERYLVETIGRSNAEPIEALHRVSATAERLRRWTVDAGPLPEWVLVQLHDASPADAAPADARYAPFAERQAYAAVCATVPQELDRPALPDNAGEADARWVEPAWREHASRVNRYLGAKAFASWTAYQSRGVRTQVAELYVTLIVLRMECVRACAAAGRTLDRALLAEAVRASDLLLVHLADRPTLMAWLGKVE